MIDDHDRCEWVNVSSGTVSPGLSGQNPNSHRMVVCVCGGGRGCVRVCLQCSRISDSDTLCNRILHLSRGS